MRHALTRAEFEAAAGSRLRAGVEELAATVRRAGLDPAGLGAVYLTGGASRTPLVSDLIASLLGILPTTTGDPKTTVAIGALTALGYGRSIVTPMAVRPL